MAFLREEWVMNPYPGFLVREPKEDWFTAGARAVEILAAAVPRDADESVPVREGPKERNGSGVLNSGLDKSNTPCPFFPPSTAVGSQAQSKRFRVALSFPGEYRPFVVQVAEILAEHLEKRRVFYDKFHEAELARPDLDTYLQEIYHHDSDLIAVFLCAEYENKDWCGLEWRAIRDLIKTRNGGSIMFFRLDDTPISGLFSIDGYVEIALRSPSEVASLVLQRLEHNDLRSPDTT